MAVAVAVAVAVLGTAGTRGPDHVTFFWLLTTPTSPTSLETPNKFSSSNLKLILV